MNSMSDSSHEAEAKHRSDAFVADVCIMAGAETTGLYFAATTPKLVFDRAYSAISLMILNSSPAAPSETRRIGTTGDPRSASVVNPGQSPATKAERKLRAADCNFSTLSGSAMIRSKKIVARRGEQEEWFARQTMRRREALRS